MHGAFRSLLLLSFPLFVLPKTPAQTAQRPSGIIVTVQYMDGARNSEEVIYLQNNHRRKEHRDEYYGTPRADGTADVRYGPRVASITRCDLEQRFELNLEDRQYEAWPYVQTPVAEAESAAQRPLLPQRGPPGPPTVRVEITTFDTGERRNFFGHVARHVITPTKRTPLGGSHFQLLEFVTGGWYLDVETRLSCEPWASSGIGLHDRRMLPLDRSTNTISLRRESPNPGLRWNGRTLTTELGRSPMAQKKNLASAAKPRSHNL